MRILALDLGDKWVGSALADPLGITCKPYKTVTIDKVIAFLVETVSFEDVATIVIGLPRTSSGTESEQTTKVRAQAASIKTVLEKRIGKSLDWVLWDERLSSKRAQTQTGSGFMKQTKGSSAYDNQSLRSASKEQKLKEHSVAACFILQTYLDGKALFSDTEIE